MIYIIFFIYIYICLSYMLVRMHNAPSGALFFFFLSQKEDVPGSGLQKMSPPAGMPVGLAIRLAGIIFFGMIA